MPAFANALRKTPGALAQLESELLALPAEMPDEQVTALADRGVALITEFITEQGDAIPRFDSSIEEQEGADAMTELMNEHMNPAQQRVMTLIIERLARNEQ